MRIINHILETHPSDCTMLLLAAKVCYNQLEDFDEAIKYCTKCIDICSKDPTKQPLLRKGYLYQAVIYSTLATRILSIQQNFIHHHSIENFSLSESLGCNDYLFYFHFAVELAETRQINLSLDYIKRSISLNQSFTSSWLVYILLLTSIKLYEEASSLCKLAISHHPDDTYLLYCDSQIDLFLKKPTKALATLRVIYENLIKKSRSDEDDDSHSIDFDIKSLTTPRVRSNDDITDRSYSQFSDGTSAKSITRDSKTKHEVGLAEVWTTIAQIFTELKQFTDSKDAIEEAAAINPINPEVAYQRGLLAEAQSQIKQAAEFYKEAYSYDNNHLKSLLKLGQMREHEGQFDIAENHYQMAVYKYPHSAKAWSLLGGILTKTKEEQQASACFKTALELDATTPILPFSWVKREL